MRCCLVKLDILFFAMFLRVSQDSDAGGCFSFLDIVV